MEYKPETKNCQNCKKDFTIESEDFNFYEKIKVPAPTWCPECRLIRKFYFSNVWNVYWRNCDRCGIKTLSMYLPESKMTVFCPDCWWKDDWDGTEYGIDYDPNRNFFEQIKELVDKTPYVSVNNNKSSLINCNYVNSTGWSKDCYLTFWADFCENIYYSTLANNLKYSLDCIRGFHSELCYESVGFSRCYRMFYSDECDDCVDVWFSRNCYGCSNCIGCVNLSGASNCILNKKYSKEDYAKKKEELKLDTYDGIKKFKKIASDFWLTKPYREYHGHSLNKNVSGDYIYTSKNSKFGYVLNGAEDSKYCQLITVPSIKDCYDYLGWGNNANLVYESVTVGENVSLVFFSNECWPDVFDLQYCIWVISGKHNFGCVNLKNKEYCILNKQYSKEEYERLKKIIIEDMKKNSYIDKLGRKFYYGEFFPLEFSKFSYNKSNAMRFFPKTKEQALREGYEWNNFEKPTKKASIKSEELPQTISETKDFILKEAIECVNCSRSYNIARGELDLLKKIGLPLPHECPKCREENRFARMNKPSKLHDRVCAKCNKNIETPYSPDRPEIIYCEECYKQEVY